MYQFKPFTLFLTIFLIATLTPGQQPPRKSLPFYEEFYPWGGIDETSQVYWPTKPPDVRPLQLAKAGNREEAFRYCFAKMKSTTGELRFFYIVQAASMGFGIWKTQAVVKELLPEYLGLERQNSGSKRVRPGYDNSLILGLAFSAHLANEAGGGARSHPSFRSWLTYYNANQSNLVDIRNRWRDIAYTEVTHLAVIASMVRHESRYSPTARQLWKTVLKSNPNSPQLNLLMSELFNSGMAVEGPGNTWKTVQDIDPDAVQKYAEAALKLDPDNVRAIAAVAHSISYKDPARAKALAIKYLSLGAGPAPEVASIKRMLERLKRTEKE